MCTGREANVPYWWYRVIWTHTNNYGSKLTPSLVSQAVTRVNCHLV